MYLSQESCAGCGTGSSTSLLQGLSHTPVRALGVALAQSARDRQWVHGEGGGGMGEEEGG